MGMSSSDKSKSVAYLRVSSPNQKSDLANQRRALEDFCRNGGYPVDEWISDTGSALNYNRTGFNRLLRDVERGLVKQIYLAHKDRLVRFGYDWFSSFCESHGTKIVTMEHETLSPEEEIVKDVLTILHVFSCRIYGLRKYRNEISQKIQDRAEQESTGKPRGTK
jgi:putative resolvase